jgi:hypothetical protein
MLQNVIRRSRVNPKTERESRRRQKSNPNLNPKNNAMETPQKEGTAKATKEGERKTESRATKVAITNAETDGKPKAKKQPKKRQIRGPKGPQKRKQLPAAQTTANGRWKRKLLAGTSEERSERKRKRKGAITRCKRRMMKTKGWA